MIELKVINKVDPLHRTAEKQSSVEEFSPMDPPSAYAPPNLEVVAYEAMHPVLQELMDEHKIVVAKLESFEETLINLQNEGINKESFGKLAEFFEFFDNEVVKHHQKEEKTLFPLLHQRLLESEEHGKGPEALTAVDMMEDDHREILQLAAVVFNFFGIAMKLPDPNSRLVVLDTAIEQGKHLVEILKLHIFREDNIVFSLANQYIEPSKFDNF